MKKLAIVADTTQDLNFELAKKYQLELIPYYLQMGDNHYRDIVDINSRDFYATMEQYEVLSTGVPSAQDVLDVLDRLKEEGYDQALLICSSAKLTGMRQLYGVMEVQFEGLELHVFDTGSVGAASGLLSIYASELNQQGLTVEEIVEELSRMRQDTKIFALFRTLKYLVRGGRFNKYKGMLGNLLNINPLLMEMDGEIGVKSKIQGTKKSLRGLIQAVRDEIGDSQRYRLVIFAGNNEKESQIMREELAEEIANAEFYLETELTAVLGVHAGPGSIGAAVMVMDR